MTTSPSRTEGSPPPVRPTGWPALAFAAAVGGLSGWAVATLYQAADASPPQVPWLTPVALLVLLLFLGLLGRSAHQRIQVRRERVEPQRAVVWLALGKSAALGGAAVAGGYLAYALAFIARLDAQLPRERVVVSLLSAAAGIGLVVVGLRLERACRVPDGDEDERGESPR